MTEAQAEREALLAANARLVAKRRERAALGPIPTPVSRLGPSLVSPLRAEEPPQCADCRETQGLTAVGRRHFCEAHYTARNTIEHWKGMFRRAAETARIAGALYAHATVADTLVADRAEEFFQTGHFGWLLMGPTGTGKTYLAVGICRMWLLAGQSLVFTSARALFRAVRETYRDAAERTESDIIAQHTEAPLLVVDDLGREGRTTEQVVSVLHDILDARIRELRPTVVTTNLGDEMADVYGPAIASRLSLLEPIVMRGPDRRGL